MRRVQPAGSVSGLEKSRVFPSDHGPAVTQTYGQPSCDPPNAGSTTDPAPWHRADLSSLARQASIVFQKRHDEASKQRDCRLGALSRVTTHPRHENPPPGGRLAAVAVSSSRSSMRQLDDASAWTGLGDGLHSATHAPTKRGYLAEWSNRSRSAQRLPSPPSKASCSARRRSSTGPRVQSCVSSSCSRRALVTFR